MILGRKVSANEEGNVDSFVHFSDQDKEDFKIIRKENVLLEISFIRYRLKGSVKTAAIASYATDVVQHGMDVEEWEKDYFK